MQTRRERGQEELFIAGSLFDLVPADHVLRRVDGAVDFSWLHGELRECYCQDNGRTSIDPESALRLMLAGFLEGIVHDRALLRRAQADLAFRWFAGYRLDEDLPDHSSLTRIRQRWLVEDAHGRAKSQHGLRRVVRRGQDNVAIQAYLTAAAMNLEKLAASAAPWRFWTGVKAFWLRITSQMLQLVPCGA